MARVRGVAVAVLLCIGILISGPAIGAAQQSASTAQSQASVESAEQPASGCFDAAGTSFTIGAADGTHIWVQLHLGLLTDSDWAFGGELIGATADASIVELVAGFEYVGDGFFDLVSSPVDSFDTLYGFDFQLPMLESAMEMNPMDPDAAEDADEEDETEEDETNRDSRYNLLDC